MEGGAALAEAEAIMERTGERFHEAELYRLKGQLVLQSHGPRSAVFHTQHLTLTSAMEAEAYFLKAIEIAQRQQAKSLELRAATSLARLWKGQGKQRDCP